MPITSRGLLALFGCACLALLSVANPRTSAQTLGEPEDFTAVAIVNNNLASGAGTVLIHISRWSTEIERTQLIDTLQKKGPDQLLDELKDMKSVGTIRTPDSLAYDLRYAQQNPLPDGGRRITIATVPRWRNTLTRKLPTPGSINEKFDSKSLSKLSICAGAIHS